MAEDQRHPATRMLTVLDWWLRDHFDNGRNPQIENKIEDLKAEIRLQIQIDQDRDREDRDRNREDRGEDSNRGNR